MTNEGFICISRGITAHWIWANPVFFQRWVWMILSANYDNREISFSCHRLMLQRGQLAVNLSYLSKTWNVSTQAALKFLVKLEVSGMVTRVVDDKVTVITICNYDRYQLKMGAMVDGSVDGMVNGEVDKVVNQTNKGNKLKTESIKTSAEVLCQVPLELDMPEAVEKRLYLLGEVRGVLQHGDAGQDDSEDPGLSSSRTSQEGHPCTFQRVWQGCGGRGSEEGCCQQLLEWRRRQRLCG